MLPDHRPWLEAEGIEIVTGSAPTVSGLSDKSDLIRLLAEADAIVGPTMSSVRLSAMDMQRAHTLKVISLASTGYDWVDVETATDNGIPVTYTPIDSLGEVVADMTWGLLLSAARRIPEHHFRLQQQDAQRGMGSMVWRRTIGIVGLGNVGQKVARRAGGFQMKVLASEKHPDMDFCRQFGIELLPLDELLAQADFVSLHLRLNEETEGIIGAREFGLMKPTSYLINTSRWRLVDEEALTDAIVSGAIAGAAIDDPPEGVATALLQHPNAIFTPHLGNKVPENVDAVCRRAYQNAMDVLDGRTLDARYLVNPKVFDND